MWRLRGLSVWRLRWLSRQWLPWLSTWSRWSSWSSWRRHPNHIVSPVHTITQVIRNGARGASCILRSGFPLPRHCFFMLFPSPLFAAVWCLMMSEYVWYCLMACMVMRCDGHHWACVCRDLICAWSCFILLHVVSCCFLIAFDFHE